MKQLLLLLFMAVPLCLVAQDRHYSAVNPVLFSYQTGDVYIKPPQKYNNGAHLLAPDPQKYPWEERLENGMPNALVDSEGNISVYFSSFIIFSPTPPSKVGVMAFTNTTNNFTSWERPNAGLYWYNPNGTTSDEKISSTYQEGFQNTNLVAVDIESLGIYDDGSSDKPMKLIYMPQREFQYKYLGAYEADRSFTDEGILSAFYDMKNDRLQEQSVFTFRNINADTHMNWLQHNGKYYFTSRVNSRRSALKEGETLPFTTDPRKRYRRSTITEVGEQIATKNLDFNVILDYSTQQWEPYGMQPFRLPGFDDDIWFGLVTMYGVEGYPDIEMKQRTELAISSNGVDWNYLKPGVPFLNNSVDSLADDFGCINIATPVYNSKLHAGRNPNDPFFFYASSRIGHTEGRNPGISLATSKYGKLAGLQATDEKIFYSVNPVTHSGHSLSAMPYFSVKKAFAIGAEFYPYILGDITEDPTGKMLTQMNSYVSVRMFSYDSSRTGGLGYCLGGSLGSSKRGTQEVSDEYQTTPFITNGVDGNSKEGILRYLKAYSDGHPQEIVSLKEFPEIPLVFETRVKNATFYGIKFTGANDGTTSLDVSTAMEDKTTHIWDFRPADPILSECHIEDFSDVSHYPNMILPTQMNAGSMALKITPHDAPYDQTALRMMGDTANYISIDYLTSGNIRYRLVKEGTDFLNMQIAPPAGTNFLGKDVLVTIESVKQTDRKYHADYNEETTVMRVKCPDLNFEQVINQEILWNFRRDTPTAVDSCYARGFAYLAFSAFVGNMNKIVVGGASDDCDNKFLGEIHQVEVADNLPEGDTDFWNEEPTTRATEEESIEKEKVAKDYLLLYPTPLRQGEQLYLKVSSSQQQNAQIRFMDMGGREVKRLSIQLSYGENVIPINAADLSRGYYILALNSQTINISRKLMILD
ncbi:MAG: T9SS type A sorting domain-containing protein [Bacteroides sp.]|nr:T9SS type A sorting domain-containing protein [Bacteroides sp.]